MRVRECRGRRSVSRSTYSRRMNLSGRSKRLWMLPLCGWKGLLPLLLPVLQFFCSVTAWPHVYSPQEDSCPGPRWNAMCRSCCEYEQILCKCPPQTTQVGYAVPCCRNDIHECDPCIIHQGCNVFDNCKRCNNGTWQPKDDFYIRGRYCAECRQGWSGGDCLKCGEVIRRPQGHVILEGYPNNAKCDWTLHVNRGVAMEFRFTMLNLEFDHNCRYDYIEIRDGASITSPVIGRYCGDVIPPTIKSSGSTLHIHFVSDGYKTHNGFSATFQELSACSSSPCMNGGTCSLDALKTFRCACQVGFKGHRCENREAQIGCVDPERPAHGDRFLLNQDRGFATAVQYVCYKPYKLLGALRRTCLSNGTWSGTAPTCVKAQVIRKPCPTLPPLHLGYMSKVVGSDSAVGRVQFFCNNSYVLSGNSKRTCQPDGTWTGNQPRCVRACREPKVSKLVRHKVSNFQPRSRMSPLHRLYYSSSSPSPSPSPSQLMPDESSSDISTSHDELPVGFHHLYSSIEYECISALYQSSGSARRTCLKTGKWSGRHISCSPVCGKIWTKPQSLTQIHWPWHAAVYQSLRDQVDPLTGKNRRRGDIISEAEEHSWQLVCSGALVSQRAVLVPAHCVTEPGQTLAVDTAHLKVLLGKHDFTDPAHGKRIQHIQVAEILVHPSYDPNGFDSDLAVLKLVEKSRISQFISPVCLPGMQGGEVTAIQAYITGWSVSGEHGFQSEVAQTGLIELADVRQCERQYEEQGLPNIITDNMLCGRPHPISSSTVCPSRTGGIILLPAGSGKESGSEPDQRRGEEHAFNWELLGLVSFGYNLQNCNPQLYTVFTRVTNFKLWIEENMK